MSEYQYYEFIAIDEPLTPKQMAELRACSSRANITPTSFVNDYQWGDLKGDPEDWMRRYFDAHVYVANWCTCFFCLRLPKSAFDAGMFRDFKTESTFSVKHTRTHWLLEWGLDENDNYERFADEDGRGWMGRLLPLRDELLRGDMRPLYLGWLAGVSAGEVSDKTTEPEPPPGLSRLTAPSSHWRVSWKSMRIYCPLPGSLIHQIPGTTARVMLNWITGSSRCLRQRKMRCLNCC